MKQKFIDWNPSEKSRLLINQVMAVMAAYERQGYRLTLRQLYYQLVTRNVFANKVRNYKMLGDVVSQGRLAGMLDWDMIEDRVRVPRVNTHWENPSHILDAAARSYYLDRWEDQAYHVEVWVEKDAVSNIIEPVCRRWDVTFLANRGYSSQSAMYDAYRRAEAAQEQECVIIYLGDHDPSGINMTDDVRGRMGLFTGEDFDERRVKRIALNMDQVERYHPPENPAKESDSRFAAYVQQFGESSWELDALEPKVLADLVEEAILEYLDKDLWDKVVAREEEQREKILAVSRRFEEEEEDDADTE